MHDFSFELTGKDKIFQARVGVIHTPHGDIQTPAFVPVGTQASVKSLTSDEIRELGTELFFVNTYHMYLRPGIDIVKKAGGLHTFMNWNKPLITDSGGFQVFSLGRNSSRGSRIITRDDTGKEETSLVSISENGVEFQSHWDGSKHLFTPERSMEYQWDLGSDIHIAFDDCTPYGVTHDQAKRSMERTHRWAERSYDASKRQSLKATKQQKPYQALYGSIQGSIFEDLRKESANVITAMDFDGFAIGGVAVGESKKEMKNVLDWVTPLLPDDRPRHLLGVGEFDDIVELVASGIDTFDCVQPTRLARMGQVFLSSKLKALSSQDVIDITKSEYAEDFRPIDETCDCYTCNHFSRAYIHHLFHVRELLSYRLATIHNIRVVNTFVTHLREWISDGSFSDRYALLFKGTTS